MSEIEFSHITTRGGDSGKTSLMNGERRSKADFLFEVLGDIDEASSLIGVARAHGRESQLPELVEYGKQWLRIQKELLLLGGHLACPAPMKPVSMLSADAVQILESWQSEVMSGMEIKGFIYPGASLLIASIDVARTVIRRAERHLVAHISNSHALNLEYSQKYLNRLSDYFFACARKIAKFQGLIEI